MMAIANDAHASRWRNFAGWAAVGAGFYLLAIWVATLFLGQDLSQVILRPSRVTAQLGLGMVFAMAVIGFTSWNRPLTPRTFRNFVIHNAVALTAFLLVIWGFTTLGRTEGIGRSEWAAAIAGATLIVVAALGLLALGSVHAGAELIDDADAAEELRERGRLHFVSLAWMVACGLLLIGLSLAGPGGALPRETAMAGVVALVALMTLLGIAAWRLSDELGRTLSYETGNMAFYLIWVAGSFWAMLAHLGYAAAPAPLDWVTLFTVLLFAASFIVLGRRKLLTR